MYLPIPSLFYKYEIDTLGNVRNAKTKQLLKPLKRTKGGVKYRFCFSKSKKVDRTVSQLLFEVHGIEPPKGLNAAVAVTLIKGGLRKVFESINSAAKFLSDKIYYDWHTIREMMKPRPAEISGWKIFYREPEKRIFRKVDIILESKYFYRENKYWRGKK